MSSVTIGNRVEVSPTTLGLVVGDVVCIVLFVVAGELRHGVDPLVHPVRVATIAFPFVVGWVLAGAFAGAFAPAVLRTVREAAGRALVAWVIAVAIGHGLGHALLTVSAFEGPVAPAFVLVSLAVGGALLIVWRGTYTYAMHR